MDASPSPSPPAGAMSASPPWARPSPTSRPAQLAASAARSIVATDGDLPGRVAAERDYWMLTQHGLDPAAATFPDGLDPADVLNRDGAAALERALATARPLGDLLLEERLTNLTGAAALQDAAQVLAARPAEHWTALHRHGRRATAVLPSPSPSPPSSQRPSVEPRPARRGTGPARRDLRRQGSADGCHPGDRRRPLGCAGIRNRSSTYLRGRLASPCRHDAAGPPGRPRRGGHRATARRERTAIGPARPGPAIPTRRRPTARHRGSPTEPNRGPTFQGRAGARAPHARNTDSASAADAAPLIRPAQSQLPGCSCCPGCAPQRPLWAPHRRGCRKREAAKGIRPSRTASAAGRQSAVQTRWAFSRTSAD